HASSPRGGWVRWSEVDFDGPLGGADARPDHLPLLPVDVAVTQVADPARAQLTDAGVADALAAAVGKVEPLLLAGHEDRRLAVGLGVALGLDELDRPALAGACIAEPELGLEALHVEHLAVAVLLEVLAEGIEHLARP